MSAAPFALPADLLAYLRTVKSIGVITGAGVSAESGIQTYRGRGGLYDDEGEGERTVEALSAPTLRRDPDRTWRVVADLARRALAAQPGAAHTALVGLEQALDRFILLSQNMDGLHRLAGSRNRIDIHGDVRDVRCESCGYRGELAPETLQGLQATPPCPACGAGLRPDVVLFGEILPTAKVEQMLAEFYEDPPELLLIAGTSAAFPYIVEPVLRAARAGRT